MTGRPGNNRPGGGAPGGKPGRTPAPGRPSGAGRGGEAPRPSSPPNRGSGITGIPRGSGRPQTRPQTGRGAGAKSAPPQAPGARPREKDSPQTLLELYRPDLAGILDSADSPAFRYAQVLEHLMHHPASSFVDASSLPADLRPALDEAGASVLSVSAGRQAADGTTKLLLAAADGSLVETVLMPYGRRLTVCISSQVGCAVGCAFCATGAMGFGRNLTTAEIVDQLRAAVGTAKDGRRITNVVYMGMGEPLLNLGSVLDSVRVLTAPSGLGLGHRALSISTVGIPSGILRLARTEPQVNLALSLHAADEVTRALLIPDGFRHALTDILEAAWQHFEVTRRKLLVEYVLIAGVNDSVDDAKRLAALLRGHVVTVNLLTWNPVRPGDVQRIAPAGAGNAGRREAPWPRRTFVPSSPQAVTAFRVALRAAHIEAVVRQSKGAGIEAACGQLAGAAGSYDKD